MQNILIIEDEVDIAELIAMNLQREGFSVETIHDGREGLALVLKNQPDLVVLDLMIPTMDGYQVLKEMQRDTRSHSIPVLMLTARSQIEDRILGLEKGADDYMTKPFSPRELVLRVKAILKRRQSTPSTTVFSHGPFVFDKNNLAFYLEEEPVNLTATEFKLLLYLCQRSGQTQDRNELLRAVWGYSDDAHSRTLDTHMKRLRQKLGESGSLIETVRGVGYLVPDI
ncbi:response regulator transcription factor [bacterium]|nr:response regulator transcription factor [Akkermansiaceae bacterium]MDA8980703.1 response regulator transcription factor [bacterium]MDA7517443.1 response regulator transcription factor [Akkermansiaceae bacterium]MDA7519100.1 response regulator transcription factor [Akkermansiaceae bacterium]MDA7674955.1 response regulator transcription factor [Akkermansiaceae bacterium]